MCVCARVCALVAADAAAGLVLHTTRQQQGHTDTDRLQGPAGACVCVGGGVCVSVLADVRACVCAPSCV